MMELTPHLDSWTIYWSPEDHPGLFVVRRWQVSDGKMLPDPAYTLHASLEEARDAIPDRWKRACFARHPTEDPVIVETWL